LNGILAHRLAPQTSTVVVTDGDTDTLVHLRNNVEINRASNNISARQLLWGRDTAQAFAESGKHGECNGDDSGSFDVILASDIIYANAVIDPLWETIQTLLAYPRGSFWMAFARREVPVTIDFVLQKAKEHGFCYKLVAESNCDVRDVENENSSENDGRNSEIEDAAGAGEIFVYVFGWEMSSRREVCPKASRRSFSVLLSLSIHPTSPQPSFSLTSSRRNTNDR
jgi:Lysine methyltransferase